MSDGSPEQQTRLHLAKACDLATRDGVFNGTYYPDYDGCIVNGYIDRLDDENLTVVKRPGLSGGSNLLLGTAAGAIPLCSICAAGTTYLLYGISSAIYLYAISYNVTTGLPEVGSVSAYTTTLGTGGKCAVAYNPSNSQFLFVFPNGALTYTGGYSGTWATSNAVAISGTAISDVAFLDGYFFIMNFNGLIYNSNLNDGTTFQSTAYVGLPEDIGQPIGLKTHLGNIIAFGTTGYQGFYDAGISSPASPLAPVPALRGSVGALFNYEQFFTSCIADDLHALYFIGNDIHGRVGAYSLQGTTLTKISTPAVDRILETNYITFFKGHSTNLAYLYGNACMLRGGGHTFFLFDGLVYDVTMNKWYIWTTTIAGSENPLSLFAATGTDFAILQTYEQSSSHQLYTFSISTYQDNGNTINFRMVTSEFDRTDNWKFLSNIDIVSDKVNTNLQIAWSDTDYQSYSSIYTVNLNNQKSNIYRLGRTRRRSFTMLHADNTPLRVHALDIYFTEGNN